MAEQEKDRSEPATPFKLEEAKRRGQVAKSLDFVSLLMLGALLAWLGFDALGLNYWWMLVLGEVPCFDEGQPGQRFTLMPWNKAESGNPDFYHLCGQGCAMQAMERFMNHGSIVSDGALHGASDA